MPQANGILEALARRARKTPDLIALHSPRGTLTCFEAESLSNQAARAFRKLGLKKGRRAALLVTPGPEMIIMAFGLIKIGAVPVMIDPGIGKKNFKACIDQAEPFAFFGIPAAHLGRLMLGWGRKTIKVNVIAGPTLPGLGTGLKSLLKPHSPDAPDWELPGPDDQAAVVFTSGSTGPSKGVVYTHGMFLAQASMQKEAFHIEPGEVDLATFPLFAMFDPYWETQTVFPDMDFTRPGKVDPRTLVATIRRHSATHMFGSPALLNRLGTYGEANQINLPSLRRVFSAGAPVPLQTVQKVAGLLSPTAKVYTPYGATEALPVTSIDHLELLELENKVPAGKGTCIGRCLPGVSLEIIRISDDPIPSWKNSLLVDRGEIGEFAVLGDNVSRAYFRRKDADLEAKIPSDEGCIWHRMGDLGYRDPEGRIWFCGRKSHRVVTPHGTLFSVMAEGVFNRHPDVFRSALVGIGKRSEQLPVICIELRKEAKRKSLFKLEEELLEISEGYDCARPIRHLLFHPGFPVDIRHNSKISREKLAVWAAIELA